jgi:phosphoglycolate phosphatase
MSRRLVIFDFDGTLADSFPWFVEAFDQAAVRFRFVRPDLSRVEDLRGLDARQLLVRHRIAPWKVPFVAGYLRKHMSQEIGRIRLFPGVGAALETLAASGLHLALLSSNSRHNVTSVLGAQVSCFRQLECNASLFGKTPRLRRMLEGTAVPTHEAIFIGDEIRDADAARHVGIAFGAVAWGYTRLPALETHALMTFSSVEDLVSKLVPSAPVTRGSVQ